jgi:hypothetical protein
VKFMLCPSVNPPRTGLIVTERPDTTTGTTVIVADAVFDVSATDFAVRVTVAGEGTTAGAVYVIATPEALALVESTPHVAPEQPVPLSVHVAPLFCASFVTVAVKFCVRLTVTFAVVGATVTPIAGATVIVAEAVRDVSAAEVAFRVTVAGEGTVAGAVYVIAAPEALELADNVPHVAPLQPVPVRVHVTPLFWASFVTVAVKFWVLLTLTVAAVGATTTPTGAVTVIAAFDVFVVSPTEVAFKVTAAGLGTLAGALYVTEVVVTFVSVPHVAPLQPVPESDHVTPLAPVSFAKVAVKFCLPMPA